jgi:hypothetical protein
MLPQEAEMHVCVHSGVQISIKAPLISAGDWDDSPLTQLPHRQQPMRSNGVQVPLIREVVEGQLGAIQNSDQLLDIIHDTTLSSAIRPAEYDQNRVRNKQAAFGHRKRERWVAVAFSCVGCRGAIFDGGRVVCLCPENGKSDDLVASLDQHFISVFCLNDQRFIQTERVSHDLGV